MQGRRIATGLIAAVAVLLPAAAYGGSVTFADPDDFEVSPDVHSTTKASFVSEGLGRRVRITVRGELGPDYRLRVLVDSRRGERADHVLLVDVRDFEVESCSVRELFGAAVPAACGADVGRAWWGVARQELDPDKRIRWRIVGFAWPDFAEVSDRAPDAGFYR